MDFLDNSNNQNDLIFGGIDIQMNKLSKILISLIALFFYISFSYMVSHYSQDYIPLSKTLNSISSNKIIISFRRIILIEVRSEYLYIPRWFINNYYFNWYYFKIVTKIEKKYTQQHVITKLKEQLEMDYCNEDDRKSLETIITEKKRFKNEKVFNKPSDCAYLAKFIMKNRSVEAIKLINSIFKEGVNQYELLPELYLQYWNYLHGIRRFIIINKICYDNDEIDDLMKLIGYVSQKTLYKCSNLTKSPFLRYLIYRSIYLFEMDKLTLNLDENESINNSKDFELMNIKNLSIQYHLAALNGLKNLMVSLKSVETLSDIDNAIIVNDELTNILNKGEKIYKNFIIKSKYAQEALKLYILFLRNSMNREDLAAAYIEQLDENEEEEPEKDNKRYEKSEKMSNGSDLGYKRLKILKNNALYKCQKPLYKLLKVVQIITILLILVGIAGVIVNSNTYTNISTEMDILVYGIQAPLVMAKIQTGFRIISIAAAAGIPPENITEYDPGAKVNVYYLEQEFLAVVYPYHNVETEEMYTIHPIYNGVVDEIRDNNYYTIMFKIYRYSTLIYNKLQHPEYLTPEFLHSKVMRFFVENAKGEFGELFLKSLFQTEDYIKSLINRHAIIFYGVAIFTTLSIISIIFFIVIPNINKSNKYIISAIKLYKSLPSNYFHEQSNEYTDQISEICENYDVEDEGIGKKKKRSKFSSIKMYKTECLNLTNFLVNSARRSYYLFAINLFCIEVFVKDRNYYQEGEEERLLMDRYKTFEALEQEIKSGKYGGTPPSEIDVFQNLYNNNDCVRHPFSMWKCDLRVYDEWYTEELANSPIDYMMVEYLTKLSEFLNQLPEKKYDLTNQEEIKQMYDDIMANPYVQFIKKISEDILGFIDQMADQGITYMRNEIIKYRKITLICHIITSTTIFITFYFLITKPIKKQLRVMDSLINVTFSIPSAVYNSSPKLKYFIEKGELDKN
ncbi:hypothetical protein BCR32DRAFT_290158 [Anaeromyces robustus]|uniref:Uncharacterized protein n=1 Tax=Anaeromyces robustus TaxID=1754192 RepID=A0A1Y1XK92_9FUNG|nr:hypothetical protein BCR32DRAFT_290158 [Anaeromyces robustus]|eukprot:ORX86171.1 hypothetical protein BCR32DRAFT_290158 [Anaeromyces robustus]